MVKSVSGGIVHDLFYLYLIIALIVGGLVLGWLGYILVKYRAQPGQERPRDAPKAGVLPAERGHPIWSYVMAIVIAGIMFGLAFGTISAVTTLEVPPEDGDRIDATVTAFQFGWRLTYPGEGGIPLSNVTRWTVPVDTAIVADVVSNDVWHNFAIPDFSIRIDAVPGQTNHIWWKAEETGTVTPVCVQLCGNGHALMRLQMDIVPKDEFRVYVAEASEREYAKLAKAGQSVNVTFDGTRATFHGEPKDPAKAHALVITHAGQETHTFRSSDASLTLHPGQTGRLYVAPGAALSLGVS